ncbi:MAG: carboxymuconolactone decarboxylase family protein, partial [Alphaproteobacteria bacterium]
QGLAPESVANILEPDCPGLDEVDRLVRDYAVQVTTKPQYLRDAMFDELKKHFTEAEIVELTLRTALCGFFNRFNDALQIGMEDGVIEDLLSRGGKREDLPAPRATVGEAGSAS